MSYDNPMQSPIHQRPELSGRDGALIILHIIYTGKSQKAHSTHKLRGKKSSMEGLSFSQTWIIKKL